MEAVRPVAQPSPVWSGRLAEWGVLVFLVLVLAAIFAHQVRQVRGEAELARIKSTLGALRTALVIAHLQSAVTSATGSAAIAQRNPFLALAALPVNYAGLADAEALASLPAGSWAFDPACACVGYRPMEENRLESPPGATTLWFQVSQLPGPLQIRAELPYRWMGQAIE